MNVTSHLFVQLESSFIRTINQILSGGNKFNGIHDRAYISISIIYISI